MSLPILGPESNTKSRKIRPKYNQKKRNAKIPSKILQSKNRYIKVMFWFTDSSINIFWFFFFYPDISVLIENVNTGLFLFSTRLSWNKVRSYRTLNEALKKKFSFLVDSKKQRRICICALCWQSEDHGIFLETMETKSSGQNSTSYSTAFYGRSRTDLN